MEDSGIVETRADKKFRLERARKASAARWEKHRQKVKAGEISNSVVLEPSNLIGAREEERVAEDLMLTDGDKEYASLRAQGFGPVESVTEMDRVHGVERSRAARVREGQRYEEKTTLYRLRITGIENYTDIQWDAWKRSLLQAMAQRPGPNAGAAIRAIEMLDKQRWERKFGTRERVEATLKASRERMVELGEIERKANERGIGVSGGGGADHGGDDAAASECRDQK